MVGCELVGFELVGCELVWGLFNLPFYVGAVLIWLSELLKMMVKSGWDSGVILVGYN